MAVPPHAAKSVLRAELKKRRQVSVLLMDHAQRGRLEADLAMRVTAGLGDRSGTVAGYVAISSEIDPSPCLAALRATGWRIALPRVSGRDSAMTFHSHAAGDPLMDGPFGLRQPPGDAPECAPDVVLAPLLGFSASGVRIGYGAGHYDRAFARLPDALRIGLAWDEQACVTLPEDAWDVRLHAIATPTRWITT